MAVQFFFVAVVSLSAAETCRSGALLQKNKTVSNANERVKLSTETEQTEFTVPLPGLLMWSDGRSATGSFMESLKRSTGLRYCNWMKDFLLKNRI